MGVSHPTHGSRWRLIGLTSTYAVCVVLAVVFQIVLRRWIPAYYARPVAYFLSTLVSFLVSNNLLQFGRSLDHGLGMIAALVSMLIAMVASFIPKVGDWSLVIGPAAFAILFAMAPRHRLPDRLSDDAETARLHSRKGPMQS